ncbi:MAG: hypothetical protein JWL65_4000 [Gammaproteobacteria bacterium]|nr:hypothetical protein [Gammaproteobacteria bacterium]
MWNLKTGDHVVTLSACTSGEARDANSHSQPIGDLQFSPDEKQLISAGWDRTARVWDVTTWRPVYTLQGHPQGLNTATACQDFIVTGSTDGSIGVWRRDSGALVRMQDLKSGPVAKLRAFPSGNRVACFSDTSVFMILDAGSGTPQFQTAFEDSQITGMHILSKERVRLATQDGRVLDVMAMERAVEVVTVVEQAVSIAHFLDGDSLF